MPTHGDKALKFILYSASLLVFLHESFLSHSYRSSAQHTHPPDKWKEEDDKISEGLAGTEIKTHQTQLKWAFIPPSFLLYDVSKDHLCPKKEGEKQKTWLN